MPSLSTLPAPRCNPLATFALSPPPPSHSIPLSNSPPNYDCVDAPNNMIVYAHSPTYFAVRKTVSSRCRQYTHTDTRPRPRSPQSKPHLPLQPTPRSKMYGAPRPLYKRTLRCGRRLSQCRPQVSSPQSRGRTEASPCLRTQGGGRSDNQKGRKVAGKGGTVARVHSARFHQDSGERFTKTARDKTQKRGRPRHALSDSGSLPAASMGAHIRSRCVYSPSVSCFSPNAAKTLMMRN
jgi:hypothetical protein